MRPSGGVPTKPLAVEEVGAGEINPDARAAETLERIAVEALGNGPLAQQRARSRLDAECPVGAAGAGAVRESLEGGGSVRWHPTAGGCLDELHRRPRREQPLIRIRGSPLRRDEGVLIAREAVV